MFTRVLSFLQLVPISINNSCLVPYRSLIKLTVINRQIVTHQNSMAFYSTLVPENISMKFQMVLDSFSYDSNVITHTLLQWAFICHDLLPHSILPDGMRCDGSSSCKQQYRIILCNTTSTSSYGHSRFVFIICCTVAGIFRGSTPSQSAYTERRKKERRRTNMHF